MKKNDVRRKRFKAPIIRTGDAPVLTTVCEAVAPDENAMRICQQMISVILQHVRCVGLAANQVGITKRVICIQLPGSFPRSFINPVIIDASDETVVLPESCMSYPGVTADITRNIAITLEYETESRFRKCEVFGDMAARVIQHEIDHLNGQCILVKAVAEKKDDH